MLVAKPWFTDDSHKGEACQRGVWTLEANLPVWISFDWLTDWRTSGKNHGWNQSRDDQMMMILFVQGDGRTAAMLPCDDVRGARCVISLWPPGSICLSTPLKPSEEKWWPIWHNNEKILWIFQLFSRWWPKALNSIVVRPRHHHNSMDGWSQKLN